ncbi:hypothetical protein JCM11641_000014 [Rhodosporidiobolus odoratus]
MHLLANIALWASTISLVFSAAVAPSNAPTFSLQHLPPSALLRRQTLSTNETYPPPSSDPFYDQPNGYHRQPNGYTLKSRKVATALDQLSTAWQVLYKTTDAQGNADATVATLFRPLEPVSPPRVMLYLAPTDTARLDCQTSFSLISPGSNATSSGDLLELLIALQKGWYVSVPDHEGSKSAFISGLTEARAGLDGLRALLAFEGLEKELKGYKAVIRGYSGGGHAAGWATQYLSTYGKGLNVVGTAMGGVPVDLYYTFDLLSGTANAYLALSAVSGLANAEPSLDQWLKSHLTPEGLTAVAYARNNSYCLDATANSTYPFSANVYTLLKGGEESLHEGTPYDVFEQNRLGRKMKDGNKGILPIPTFMYHSKTDESVSYAPIKPYYLSQCSLGAKIHLATISASTHVEGYLTYLGDSYAFLQRAFEGSLDEEMGGGCKATDGVELDLLTAGYREVIGEIASQQIAQILASA